MKRFREFLIEDPSRLQSNRGEGIVDIENESVREGINALLAQVTACSSLTPYIAFYKAVKVLASFHINLPQTRLSGERGRKVFDINQFGLKVGMNNDGKVVTAGPSEFKFYFEYEMNDRGTYDIYCEIIDGVELDDIEDDIDLEEQTVFEALSSFGQAYRNARLGNQGTFNWRGKSYDSELKSRPVNQSARQQSSTVPIPKSSPVKSRAEVDKAVLGPTAPDAKSKTPNAAQRDKLDAAVFGTPKPTATSTTTAAAGAKSRLAQNNSGPASSVANAQAGPKATVKNGPEVPLPRPKPQPSPNLDAASKPDVPPIANPNATSSVAPPYNPNKPGLPLAFDARWNPETDNTNSTASDALKTGMAGAAEKAKEAQKPTEEPEQDKKVAVKEELLSETDSKFTRMLKQRRG